MFERPTVFIVGAGGSKEVGLPMGSELTRQIASKVSFRFPDGFRPEGGDISIYETMKWVVQQRGQRDPNPLIHAGQALSRAMAQAISIDNYLHTHSSDEDITLVGKLGIASAILEAERNATIAPRRDEQLIDFGNIHESWHAVFCKMLTEGVSKENIGGIFDNVSIITFNYDRCIEYYMLHALQNYFRLTLGEAEALVKTLTVIHPYGHVGDLPESKKPGVAFGQKLHHARLPEVAAQIRTFTEQVEDEGVLGRMHDAIARAEVVVYLGFSYGDMNMNLMTVGDAGERVIYGTSLGLSAANKRIIQQDIVNSMGADPGVVRHLELADMKCSEFLYAYWKPILRGV